MIGPRRKAWASGRVGVLQWHVGFAIVYTHGMDTDVTAESRPLRWLHGEIKTPPFSAKARQEAGGILREIQDGRPVKFPPGGATADDWPALWSSARSG